MSKIVYICSAFRNDDPEIHLQNIDAAKMYSLLAMIYQGEYGKYIPITPHLLYPQFLDDTHPDDRDLGISAGLRLVGLCDEMWVFGKPTEGMEREIATAEDHQIPIIYKQVTSEKLNDLCGHYRNKTRVGG